MLLPVFNSKAIAVKTTRCWL